MNSLYEKLYDCIVDPFLADSVSFDEAALRAMLCTLPLDADARFRLMDEFSRLYVRWTCDAFSLGVQTGVALTRR